LNFEFNLQCFDESLGSELDVLIADKASDAREIRLDDINRRSLPVQLRDGLARLLSPYM
jgi:cardiolipin synthase